MRQVGEIEAAGVTFAVADVARATQPLPEVAYADALGFTLRRGSAALEAYSRDTKCLLQQRASDAEEPVHAFVHALNLAYDQHRPVILSPDMIWLLIAQGFAQHQKVTGVAPGDKTPLTVRRDDFVQGFAGNPWEDVLDEFSQSVRQRVGDATHRCVVRRFSTSGPVEQAACAVTLMDAFQSFFDYGLLTACGIPEITLEGTPGDWQSVQDGAALLAQRGDLNWWTDHLLPVLEEFARASRGQVNPDFWRNVYKRDGQSGGPHINGHLLVLFPYLVLAAPHPDMAASDIKRWRERGLSEKQIQEKLRSDFYSGKTYRNQHLGYREPQDARLSEGGIVSAELPPALSLAAFTWHYYDTALPMEFIAGFVGIAQKPDTLALRPEIGWAVRPRSTSAN